MTARCQNIDAQKPAIMRRVRRAACGLAAATWFGTGTAMALDVGDIGSFYVGGKTIELKGCPSASLCWCRGRRRSPSIRTASFRPGRCMSSTSS